MTTTQQLNNQKQKVDAYVLANQQHFRLPTRIMHTIYEDNNLKSIHRELYIRLLIKLEEYNNVNHMCQNYYPVSIEKIRAWFGQSAKTIREHIHVLSKHGYIQEEGITKLNKNRPILIGVRFLTLKFSPIENNEPTKIQPTTIVVKKEISKPIQTEIINKAPKEKVQTESSLTKAQQLKQQMDQLNQSKNSPSVHQKELPLANKNVHPKSTKKGHNNQIKDQIDLISDPEKIDLIKKLQKRKDIKKITLPQFNKILQRLTEKEFSIAKELLFKILCQMQFDMNSEKWRTPDYTHQLNSILMNMGRDINNYKVWIV